MVLLRLIFHWASAAESAEVTTWWGVKWLLPSTAPPPLPRRDVTVF